MTRPVDVDGLVDRYLDDPAALKAYRNDPTYHASIKMLRQTLEAVDGAMLIEEVPNDVRQRVIYRTLNGCGPDEPGAWRRIADHDARTAELAAAPLAPADLYERLGISAPPAAAHLPGDDVTGGWRP